MAARKFLRYFYDWDDRIANAGGGPTEESLMKAIARHDWEHPGEPISLPELASLSRISRPTVARILPVLVKAQLVQPIKSAGKSSVYKILDVPEAAVAQEQPDLEPADHCEDPEILTVPEATAKAKPSKTRPRPKATVTESEAFRTFYREYPLKKSPDRAWTAWRQAVCRIGDEEELLRRCLDVLAWLIPFEEFDGARKTYCPYPASWLNDGGYKEDRPAECRADEWGNIQPKRKPEQMRSNRRGKKTNAEIQRDAWEWAMGHSSDPAPAIVIETPDTLPARSH